MRPVKGIEVQSKLRDRGRVGGFLDDQARALTRYRRKAPQLFLVDDLPGTDGAPLATLHRYCEPARVSRIERGILRTTDSDSKADRKRTSLGALLFPNEGEDPIRCALMKKAVSISREITPLHEFRPIIRYVDDV